MLRLAALVFGITSYVIFLGTVLYAIGFVTNLHVPKAIDSHEPGPPLVALGINLLLLALFGIQHSVMARISFKAWWTRFVPPQVERSVYVLLSCAVMLLVFYFWEPMTGVVFQVEAPAARRALHVLFLLGVGLILYATFLIDHFDLFGLRHVWLYFRRREYVPPRFMTPGLYRHIRHPLYLGWLVFFWATPDMTVGHLLLAVTTTGYILMAIVFEERDLAMLLGDDYLSWRARTPMFVPSVRGEESSSAAAS